MNKFIVITTINDFTESIIKFSESKDWNLIIVADKNTPVLKKRNNIEVLSIKWQDENKYKYIKLCPFNHYSRKNIGYIYAINNRAEYIYDTDDDNIPYMEWEKYFNIAYNECDIAYGSKYINIYKLFTEKKAWPRGYPLNKINVDEKIKIKKYTNEQVALIQGLADKDPDVDAIYRMTIGKSIKFHKRSSIILGKNSYCPVNSQNTLWSKEAFVYLYLPLSVSFRFTDILRGYVAQRGIWEINKNVAFISPSVYQNRNVHDLMKDFYDEIECYLNVEKVVNILDNLKLEGDPKIDIKIIYNELYKNSIVKEYELLALDAWIGDISTYN